MPNPNPYEALEQILEASGRSPSADDRVVIEGEDPVLPTAFRLGTAGAAAIAATGLGASDLWRLKTGRGQEVEIDMREASAAIRSDRFLRIDGREPPSPWSATAGFYRTRDDRWLQLHSNFPNHLEAAVRVLGCAPERGAMTRAIANRDAFELEEALIEAGMCSAVVRSEAEWRSLPQAEVVEGLPLFEVVKLADGAPEPLPPGERPLSGVRVLDLTRVIAGPVGGRTLAAHGADVMRVTSDHLPGFPGSIDIDMGHGKLSANLSAGVPSRVAGGARLFAGGADGAASGPDIRDVECLRARGPVERPSRLRQHPAVDERNRARGERGRAAAAHAGTGAGLRVWLPAGVRDHAGAGAARGGGRQLPGANIAGADGIVDPGARPRGVQRGRGQ
jgi:hypothetical protein